MKVRVRMRGPELGGAREGTPEIFFADHDGIVVQLQDVKYGGGAGVLGDVVKVEPSPTKGTDRRQGPESLHDFGDGRSTLEPVLPGSSRCRDSVLSGADRADAGHRFDCGIHDVQRAAAPRRGGAPAARPPPRPAGINHSCMTMENFNVEHIQKALESVGIKPRAANGPAGPMQHYISLRMENRGGAKEGTPELYFTDPDGLLVQLQDVSYCGGGGYLGNVCPPL